MISTRLKGAACLFFLAGLAHSQPAVPEERRNWFGDPFFQVSQGVPACPVPLGPLLTRDEQRAEAHVTARVGHG